MLNTDNFSLKMLYALKLRTVIYGTYVDIREKF